MTLTIDEVKHFHDMLELHGNDTVVRCKTCKRTQYLLFKNGLVNGWSKCHNHTMSIIYHEANISRALDEAVGSIVKKEMKND